MKHHKDKPWQYSRLTAKQRRAIAYLETATRVVTITLPEMKVSQARTQKEARMLSLQPVSYS